AKIRQELREWQVKLHHDLNVTTIFVTHDQDEALEVSNRIVISSSGNIAQVATPRAVHEQPANEFVARSNGVMNNLDAEVNDGTEHRRRHLMPGQDGRSPVDESESSFNLGCLDRSIPHPGPLPESERRLPARRVDADLSHCAVLEAGAPVRRERGWVRVILPE